MISPTRRLSLTLCAVLVASASLALGPAAGQQEPRPLDTPLVADLDGDGAAEVVRARPLSCIGEEGPTDPPCPPGRVATLVVEVVDACAKGQLRRLRVSREMDFVQFASIIDANADGRVRELAFEVRAGAAGRGVQSKVVRFRRGSDDCIAVRKSVFSYPRAATVGRTPRGTRRLTGYVQIADYSSARRGLELRVREFYVRDNDPYCCPSFRRTTFFTYSRKRGAYRAYRSTLSPIATR